MLKYCLLWLTFVFVVMPFPADIARADEQVKLTKEEQKALEEESDRLWQETLRLDSDGKLNEAIATGQKMVAALRRLGKEREEDLAYVLGWTTERQALVGAIDAARAGAKESLSIATRLHGEGHWKLVERQLVLNDVELLARISPEQRQQVALVNRSMREVSALHGAQKFQEAIALAEKSATTLRQVLGAEHHRTGHVYYVLGSLYGTQNEHERSIQSYERALAAVRANFGEEHVETAYVLNNLGHTYDLMARYSDAEPLYQKTLAIRRKLLGSDDPLTAAALHNLASLLVVKGKYQQGESMHQEALEIRRKALGERHADVAASLNALGYLDLQRAEYSRAEQLHKDALEIRKAALGVNHLETAVSYGNVALAQQDQGKYQEAEQNYREALAITQRVLGDSHSETARYLENLATVYHSLGDSRRAEPMLRQSLAIRKRVLGANHPLVAMSLNNLAGILEDAGDYAGAEGLLVEASNIPYETLGKEHSRTLEAACSVAHLYTQMGQYSRAERIHRHVLATRERVLGLDHQHVASSLQALAWVRQNLGDVVQAEQLYRRALEIQDKRLGRDNPETSRTLNYLARAMRFRGRYEEAVPYFTDGLSIHRRRMEEAAFFQSERQQLAMMAAMRGYLDEFISFGLQAPHFSSTIYAEVLAWKGSILAHQKARRELFDRPETLALSKELRAATTRLANLSFQMPSSDGAAAWQKSLADLSAHIEELERKLAGARPSKPDGNQSDALKALKATLPAKSALVDFLAFSYAELPQPGEQGLRWQRKLAAFVVLPDKDVVQLVDLGEAKSVWEAVDTWRKDQGQSLASSAAGRLIREKIWEPVERHLGGANVVLISPDGDLAKLPFGALPGKEPGRFLVEDFAVAVVPMPQAIVGSKLEDQDFKSSVPGRGDSTRKIPTTLLLVGGVDYDRRAAGAGGLSGARNVQSGEAARNSIALTAARSAPRDVGRMFAPLAGAAAEIGAIERLFEDSFPNAAPTRLQAGSASQDAVVETAISSKYLHLATHGYFAAPRFKSALDRSLSISNLTTEGGRVTDQSLAGFHPGLLSGLALAGANEPIEKDDGILTAEEVSSMNLMNAELVVLSACETGLGNSAAGEGLLGLQRAFQAAAAKSVVASLWSVPDQATRLLMVRFYENLWKKKMSKLEALREAQLWMLREGAQLPEIRREMAARGLDRVGGDKEQETGNKGRLPPYYWAAWVLSGEWR